MAGITLKIVNKAIAEKYPTLHLELVKGEGYFYLYSDNDVTALKLAGLYTTSIGVYSIKHFSIDRWLTEIEYILKDSQRLPFERTPLI